MTRIRATCPVCGEVDLRPQDVLLRLVREMHGEVGESSSYRFSCPACEGTVVKPADGRIAKLLTTGGVPVEETDEDTEFAELAADLLPPHPEAPPSGPPLTYDDLLDLHQALAGDHWLTGLLDAGMPG